MSGLTVLTLLVGLAALYLSAIDTATVWQNGPNIRIGIPGKPWDGSKEHPDHSHWDGHTDGSISNDLKVLLEERYSEEVLEGLWKLRKTWKRSDIKQNGGAAGERDFVPTALQLEWWSALGARSLAKRKKRQVWAEPMVRREYRTLSRQERLAYHRALWAMKTTMIGNISEYDLFVQFHQEDWAPTAHFGAAFIPWHREFIFRFELVLQSHEPTATLPYWDSRLDRRLPNPRDSIIFSDEFMGDPFGIVDTGPFRGFPVFPRCRFGQNTTLVRGGDVQAEALYQDSDLEYFLNRHSFRDLNVPAIFEWEHGGPHLFVGGQMGNVTCSPADPIFWSHHSFVDAMFQAFRDKSQTTDKVNEYPVHENLTNDIGGEMHNGDAVMYPFEPLENRHGLMTFYTDFYYRYAPFPYLCNDHADCGRYLWCHQGRCMSKVKLWGNCTGLPEGRPEVCECGVCNYGTCAITEMRQFTNCWS